MDNPKLVEIIGRIKEAAKRGNVWVKIDPNECAEIAAEFEGAPVVAKPAKGKKGKANNV